MSPLSAERYGLQVTIGQSAYDKLRYAQALLGHVVPSGDLAEVLERALDALIARLEKQKFAATSRPGRQRSSADPRHIPAHVKRTVWLRDGAQCTFVSDAGHRCPSRARLEYDHVDPVARGGEATVDGIRLRCRAHNQYEAECAFGVGFMEAKREAARLAAVEARARAALARADAEEKRAAAAERARVERAAAQAARAAMAERTRAERAAAQEARARAAAEQAAAKEEKARQLAAEQDPERSVIPWLMRLGARADEARRAAAASDAAMPGASLEERLRFALSTMAPAHRRAPAGMAMAG